MRETAKAIDWQVLRNDSEASSLILARGIVEWSLNDGDARGGGIDVTLDVTGTEVVSIKRVE